MSDWPNTLPGLNLEKALGQLGGKKTLYIRLLGMFNDGHTNDANRIIEAAAQQDWTAVNEINHALKGVSGNLAALDLYDLCVAVDNKMKSDNHDIADELAAFPKAMEDTLQGIAQAMELPTE
jgi:HPt (histidine-containing phosphotransfer) domain-containing protein